MQSVTGHRREVENLQPSSGMIYSFVVAPCSLRVLCASLSINSINMQGPHLPYNGASTRFSSTEQSAAAGSGLGSAGRSARTGAGRAVPPERRAARSCSRPSELSLRRRSRRRCRPTTFTASARAPRLRGEGGGGRRGTLILFYLNAFLHKKCF